MFSIQSAYKNPLIATFQLSSAASLDLRQSQNGILGNGLITHIFGAFQFDNVKRVFKTVEEMPGSLEKNIQTHYLLSDDLARLALCLIIS